MSMRCVVFPFAFAVAAATAPVVQASDAVYADAAGLQADLVQVLSCEAGRAQFMRVADALMALDGDAELPTALDGWRRIEGDNPFIVELAAPQPFALFGQTSDRIVMAGQGLLAVIEGEQLEALSRQLALAPSALPMTGHIRVRDVRRDALGDGVSVQVVQTASTLTSHPGSTLVGCEYRLAY